MKNVLTIILLFAIGNSQAQILKTDPQHEKYKDSSSKGKQIISYNSKRLKDGVSKFYNAAGKLDSTVTFKNNVREGLKTFFYTENDIVLFVYKNNRVIKHTIIDSNNNIKYASPLDISKIGKTTFRFSSGRDYFSSDQNDTIFIKTDDVPPMNFNIYFPGATVIKIDNNTYAIRKWNTQPNTTKGKMVVDIFDRLFSNSRMLRHDVFLVDVR